MPELEPDAAARAQLPPLVVGAFLACVAGAASLANCALLAALLRRTRNGLFSILTQLAVADIILLSTVIAPELWSYNLQTWSFGLVGCVAYKGIDVFASTASLYLIATVALHSLATLNLEERRALRRIKRNQDTEDEEIRSSRHSLVANSDSSTPPRTMHIDYRMSDVRVPVAPPTIFVWILAASLSVPEFALTTIRNEHGFVTCSLMDSSHRINMHTMLAVFNFILPVIIFCAVIALAIVKLRSIKNLGDIDRNGETVAGVKLSLCLIFVYSALCAPRSIFSIYLGYSSTSVDGALQHSVLISSLCLALSSTCLIATLVRPVLCMALLPRLRRIVTIGAKNIDVDSV